jgi:hypothetical protein
VEVVEVTGVRIGIAARQVTDRRRRVGAAVAGMDVEMDCGIAHGPREGESMEDAVTITIRIDQSPFASSGEWG